MDAMKAEFEIRQIHARYVDAIFRKDAPAVGKLFARDGEWRVGGQVVKGRENVVSFLTRVFPQFQRILMTFRTPVVDVLDGEVIARTYVSEQSIHSDGKPFAPIGVYYDRFIEEDGQILLNWRLFQTHYAGPPDLSAGFLDVADYGAPPAMPPLDELTVARSAVGPAAGGQG